MKIFLCKRRLSTSACRRAATLLVLLLAAFAQAQAAQGDHGLLWRVQVNGVSHYLLGSIHLGTADLYPLPRTVREAYAASQVLVVEADVVSAERSGLPRQLAERGFYDDDRGLMARLGEARWQRLAGVLQEQGIPPRLAARMRPWLLYTQLGVSALVAEGLDPRYGIDQHFLELAAGKRPIRELEGLQAQLDLLAGLPEPLQLKLLMDLVSQMERHALAAGQLLQAWRQGDVEALRGLLEEEYGPELEPVRERLIEQRNRQMARRLRAWFQSDRRSHFVVVGAFHLVGAQSIPALLRAAGLEVQPLRR